MYFSCINVVCYNMFLFTTHIPPLIVSIKNKCMFESEINSNSIFVIFNILCNEKPGRVYECLGSKLYVS